MVDLGKVRIMKKSYILLLFITGILQAQPDFEEQIDTTCAGGWNDSWMDLGAIEIDDSSQCMLFVENQGYDDLIISNIHIGESQNDNPNTAFSVTVDSLVIPPEGLDSIVVYFYPEDVGFYSGSLSFETNDDSSPMHNEALHGTGLSPVREIYIYTDFDSDTIYYYDAELGDTDYIEYLYITNLGNTELEIDDIVATEPFYVDINDVSLGTLEWLEIPIEFIPEINGEYFGTVTIYSNDSDESELIVHLVGTTQDDCTADDGTEGVELWGVCYSIENTQILNLHDSGLTGSIPPEIGNLNNLTELDLSDNDLTGSIPSEIGNLSNLTKIHLYDNDLTGSLPSEIWNLTNLTDLHTGNNDLTGSIPSEIGNLTNLTNLALHSNDLTGSIPSEIGNLTNLTWFVLQQNQLTGSIPSEIGNLTNLTHTNMSDNQLAGIIPLEIANMTNLTGLDISTNQLTGEIPETICDLNLNWSWSSIHTNQFCPPYPSCTEDYLFEQDTSNCPQGINVLYPIVSDTFSSHIDSNTDIVFIWDENDFNYNPTYRLTIELDFFNISYTDVYDNISDTSISIPANNLDALLAGLNLTESALSWYVDAYYEEEYSYSFASDTGSFYLMRGYLDIHDNKYTPKEFILFPNYPNPFNPITTLRYELPEDSFVDVTVYDMLGNVVSNLVNANQSSGYKSIQWDATNNQGEPVSAGVYLYKIQAGDFIDTKKMILLK